MSRESHLFGRIGRRLFLAGAGGSLVAVPMLESLAPRRARASDGALPFLIVFQQLFGVQQQARFGGPHSSEPEGFWPDLDVSSGMAALSDGSLPDVGVSDRALHELRGLEPHLAILRGVRMQEITANHHETRRAQLLTGSAHNYERPDPLSDHHMNAWGRNESLDFKLARELDGSRPILCGKNNGTFQISYDQTLASPSETRNPLTVYDTLFRTSTATAHEQLRRSLATDAVAAELSSLRADTRLSSEDRLKLERHFDALREVEVRLTCMVPELGTPGLANLARSLEDVPTRLDDGSIFGAGPRWQDRLYPEESTLAFMELLALGASCNAFRAATFAAEGYLFSNTDIFPEGGERERGFSAGYHGISHRTLSPEVGVGEWSGAGVNEHHRVDRWYARKFRFLVERLRELGALDQGVCVFTNEIATGAHDAVDVPFVLAGNCGGRLRTGFFADLHGPGAPDVNRLVPNNRLLNTIGAAMGLRSADGQPLHDFGGIREDGSVDEGGFVEPLVAFTG